MSVSQYYIDQGLQDVIINTSTGCIDRKLVTSSLPYPTKVKQSRMLTRTTIMGMRAQIEDGLYLSIRLYNGVSAAFYTSNSHFQSDLAMISTSLMSFINYHDFCDNQMVIIIYRLNHNILSHNTNTVEPLYYRHHWDHSVSWLKRCHVLTSEVLLYILLHTCSWDNRQCPE